MPSRADQFRPRATPVRTLRTTRTQKWKFAIIPAQRLKFRFLKKASRKDPACGASKEHAENVERCPPPSNVACRRHRAVAVCAKSPTVLESVAKIGAMNDARSCRSAAPDLRCGGEDVERVGHGAVLRCVPGIGEALRKDWRSISDMSVPLHLRSYVSNSRTEYI